MRILTKQEQSRFNLLQERDDAGTLSAEERTEMEELEKKVLEAEETYLGPATARLKAHNDAAEERVLALKAFNERQAKLARRLEKMMKEMQREREALRQEWRRLYGKNSTPPAAAG